MRARRESHKSGPAARLAMRGWSASLLLRVRRETESHSASTAAGTVAGTSCVQKAHRVAAIGITLMQ